jgi:hypothetical protein
MAYTEGNYTTTTEGIREGVNVRPASGSTFSPMAEYHDSVRWGPIFAGIVVAVVCQLLLSALGGVVAGFSAGEATAGSIGTGFGIWAVLSLLVSLFLGGWIMATSCGPMRSKTAMLNAIIMWATTLVLSGWLLASGVSGTFGIAAANAGDVITQIEQSSNVDIPSQAEVSQVTPNVSAQEADRYAATASKAGLSFLIGTLLGLVAALVGATVGAKKPRMTTR